MLNTVIRIRMDPIDLADPYLIQEQENWPKPTNKPDVQAFKMTFVGYRAYVGIFITNKVPT